ncbi:MAG: rRNA maturation RNase YbeY [bacterium]|nr:rRNA maturation RNase YbeY [bacterium]
MEIEIFNQTGEKIDKELDEIKKILVDFCKREGLLNVIFNIIIVDEDTIRDLNKQYRNIDRPTDVISFALEDDDKVISPNEIRILGDIYICLNKVYSQASEYGHSFKRELTFLAVHGLLHLLGYDHIEKEDEEVMFKKQEEVLNYYGINR